MGATYPNSPALSNKRSTSKGAESTGSNGPKRVFAQEAILNGGPNRTPIMPSLNEYMETTNQYPERRISQRDPSPARSSESDALGGSEEDSESGTGINQPTMMLKPENGPSTVILGAAIPEGHDRRQAHIASEQKRRQSINEGFEDLRRVIPSCTDTSDSKAVVLRKAVNYIRLLQSDPARHKAIPQYEQRGQSPVGYAAGPSSLRTGYGPAYGMQYGGQYVMQPMGMNSPPIYHASMMSAPPTHSSASMGNPAGHSFVRMHHPTPQQLSGRPMSGYTGPQLPPMQHPPTTLPPLQLPYLEGNEAPYNREDYVSAASLSMLRQDAGLPSIGNVPGEQQDQSFQNPPFAHNDCQ
ncbi:hypothetical protein PSACC_00819 [Paramicrosporidium saccamoebae]|uniref:BHLH domain-containing protein n=1 Tax=Paramicrosporidium saccamoebae TaxID=1246581 RepID=A0A2H9TNU4_9FUNG|nr:hypothetical protein PSACC_00819 [Paramicrosporidium saccamoebae]